jgi:hypothetical protein
MNQKKIIIALFSFTIALLASPMTATAQRLPELQAGTKVRVESHQWGTVVGTLDAVSKDSFYLTTRHGAREFALDSLRSASIVQSHSRSAGFFRGLGMGALLGGLAGGIIGAVSYQPCTGWCILQPTSASQNAAVGAVVLAIPSMLVGGMIGIAHPTETWKPINVR